MALMIASLVKLKSETSAQMHLVQREELGHPNNQHKIQVASGVGSQGHTDLGFLNLHKHRFCQLEDVECGHVHCATATIVETPRLWL